MLQFGLWPIHKLDAMETLDEMNHLNLQAQAQPTRATADDY